MPKDEVRSGIALDGSQALDTLDKIAKKWEDFRKNVLAKHGATIEEQRAAYAKLDNAIKQISKTEDKYNSKLQKTLDTFRAEKEAVRQNVSQLEELEKAAEKTAQAQAGVPTDAIESFNQFREEVAQSYTSLADVEKEIKRVNAELLALRTSKQAESAATQQQITQDRLYIAALRERRDELKKVQQEEREVARAQEKRHATVQSTIRQLLTWGAGVASVYYLYRKLRVMLVDTFKDVYGATESYKEASDALDKLKESFLLALVPPTQAESSMERVASWADELSKTLLRLSAIYQGFSAIGQQMAEDANMGAISNWPGAKFFAGLFAFISKEGLSSEEAQTALNALIETWERSNELLDQNTEDLKKAESAAASLADQYRKLAEAQREIDAARAAAYDTYRSSKAIAQGNLAAGLMQIEIDLGKSIAKINADALKARENAYKDYQANLTKAQKDANKQRADDQARHDLEMEFARRRYLLDQLQNERMYQYERSLLVAEGDVLAIEDLDARNELEKKTREENFQLQMEQAEAMYRLQARIMQEAMRDQIKQLQEALQDQLQQIEENRREKIDEAEAGAEEERKAAKDAYADALDDALAAYEDEKEEQRKAEEERLKQNAEFLAQFAIDNNIALNDLLKAWQDQYGENSELVRLTTDTYNEIKRETEYWAEQMNRLMSTAGAEAGRAFSDAFSNNLILAAGGGSGGFGGGLRGSKTNRSPNSFAYGTDQVVSSPTTFVAGEGYSPERVVVEPLSPIGGNIGVSWSGNPIPVAITGANGMDAAIVNNAINAAFQSFTTEYIRQRSNSRGQRGR